MLLLLIRHGLTDQTGSTLTGWTPGVGLSETGRAQAGSLVRRLEGVPLAAIYSSPLQRCVETAHPLARARRTRIQKRKDLGEVHYGELSGKSFKVIARSKMWRHFNAWPSDVRFPGGENLRETQARAVAAVDALRTAHPNDTIAVFTHADWIRLAFAHYAGIHIDLYRRVWVDPASVSALAIHDHGVAIRRLSDTGSLADLVPPPAKASQR